MKTSQFKSHPVVLALIGVIVAVILLAIPSRPMQLAGAVTLVVLPGYWTWRLLGLRSSLFSPFTWAATFLSSLVVVPLTINIVGLAFGLSLAVITMTLVALTLLTATLCEWRKTPDEPLIDGKLPTWIYALLVGLSVFLAFLVVMTYIPIRTPEGLPWVTMGDWDKHGALIWTLADTGVPPEDIFIGSAPAQTLAYYYFFHLIAAVLHILTRQSLDLRLIFILPTAALAFSFPLLLFSLAYSLFKRARSALLTTYFVTWVGGLDLVAIWFLLKQRNLSRLDLDSWMKFLHIDAWSPPRGVHINVFYTYFIWVPHHLAALVLLIAAWFLWMRRSRWQFARFWAPLIFASMMGFSVYVTIVALSGLGVWLAWEAALA